MAELRNDIAHRKTDPGHDHLDDCFAPAVEAARRLALHELGIGLAGS